MTDIVTQLLKMTMEIAEFANKNIDFPQLCEGLPEGVRDTKQTEADQNAWMMWF